MADFGSRNRPALIIEGAPMGARIVPHKTDDTKLVLKGPPDFAQNLCAHMGIDDYKAIAAGEGRGGYHSVEVDKAKFLAAIPEFLTGVLDANEPTQEAPEPIEEEESEESPADLDGMAKLSLKQADFLN